MTAPSIIGSVISGIAIGFLYGHFFVIKRRSDLLYYPTSLQKAALKSIFFTSTRIGILLSALYYLLRLGTVHFILVVPTLILTFLITVYRYTKNLK